MQRPAEEDWPPWSVAVRRAWSDLRNERDFTISGAGAIGGFVLRTVPGPLRWSAYDRWARRHDVDGESYELLWRLLRALDAEYLDHVREGLEAENRDGHPPREP